MIDIEKLDEIKGYCEQREVKLVAVSKTKSNAAIQKAYKAGHKIFGENRVQEVVPKYESLPRDIEWHMVGHLQRNKVKYIAPFVSLIHSVDSIRLLNEIDKQASKADRVIDCLLEVHIAEEATKHGFSEDELNEYLASSDFRDLHHVSVRGLMGMATYTDDEAQIRKEFRQLASLFGRVQKHFFAEASSFCELSMGMTNDYQIAVEEGSTMIRIGSLIFGERT